MHGACDCLFFRVFCAQTLVVARGLCHALQNRVSAALRTLAIVYPRCARVHLDQPDEQGRARVR